MIFPFAGFFFSRFRLLAFVFLFYSFSVASSESVSMNFVDVDLKEVARALGVAYGLPIVVEHGVSARVTIHLENLEVWDALQAICSAYGFSFAREAGVFYIRPLGRASEFFFHDGLMDISVENMPVGEFLRKFALYSGVNVSASPELSGNISAKISNLSPKSSLRSILLANHFKVIEQDECFLVFRESENSPLAFESLRTEWRDSLFFVSADEVPLGEIVRALARLAKKNIVFLGEMNEAITVRLENVSFENALDALFFGGRFAYSKTSDGTLLLGERSKKSGLSLSKLYELRHLSSSQAVLLLGQAFSNSGLFLEVREQNAVLLLGSSAEIGKAEQFLKEVDIPIPQIELECIIVEFRKGKNFGLGLHSGTSRKTIEGSIGAKMFFEFPGKTVQTKGGLGRVGLLSDRFEIELASLEEKNLAEVLARPSVSTLNGRKASIYITNTSYYQVSQVSADGYPITDYRSFNDGISLDITPSVARSGEITIDIAPEIKTSARVAGDGPRDISTRSLQTTVSLREGETLCLGGLLRKTTSKVESGIPFLGSLPLLGRLFRYVSEEEETTELAVFITPKLLPSNGENKKESERQNETSSEKVEKGFLKT